MDNTTTTFAPTSFVYCGHVFVVFYSLVYLDVFYLLLDECELSFRGERLYGVTEY